MAGRGGRRRWPAVVGALAAIAVLGGAAELALRLIVPGVVAAAVRDQLGLTPDHPVEVSLGGSALLHAIRGGVGDVSVRVPAAPLVKGIAVDAAAHADFSPFDPARGEIRGATVALTVPEGEIGSVVSLLTRGVAQTGEVRDGELVVGRTVEVLGQRIPLTATIAVAVSDGDVEVEPRGLSAGGLGLGVEQIARATGSLLDPILRPHVVCVRDRLPAGVSLTEIALSSTGSVTLRADVDPRIASDPRLLDPGSCGA